MLANYHTHTYRCQHASGEDKEYIEAAIKCGMKILGFSDHCPWFYPNNYISDVRMAPSKVDNYVDSIQKLKAEYKKDIAIYLGFECEYLPELLEQQTEFLKDYPIDYLILGQHTLCPEPEGIYTNQITDDQSFLTQYIDLVIEGLDTGRYRYLAHPDIVQFTGSEKFYTEEMTRLCTYLKQKNIPIEINALGICVGKGYTSKRFLEIAKKVGNSAIIGIDAHSPEQLEQVDVHNQCIQLAREFDLPIMDYLDGLGIQ